MKRLPKEQELKQLPAYGPLDFGPIVQALVDINYSRLDRDLYAPRSSRDSDHGDGRAGDFRKLINRELTCRISCRQLLAESKSRSPVQGPFVPRSNPVVRIILLVSCAHALVHLLEQSIASVEQVISTEFTLSFKESGFLGSCTAAAVRHWSLLCRITGGSFRRETHSGAVSVWFGGRFGVLRGQRKCIGDLLPVVPPWARLPVCIIQPGCRCWRMRLLRKRGRGRWGFTASLALWELHRHPLWPG